MSTFKCKPDKIKHLDNIETLDTIHKKQVNEFDTRRNNLNELKRYKTTIEKKLNDIKIDDFTDSVLFVKKRSLLKDELEKITNDIYDIENNISELEYYCKIDDILFDYYNDKDIIENTKNINTMYTGYDNNNILINSSQDKMNDKCEIDTKTNLCKLETGNQKLQELESLSQQKRKPKKETRRRMRKNEINDTSNILNFFISTKPDNNGNTININKEKESCTTKIEHIVSNKATLFNNYMRIITNTTIGLDKKDRLVLCDKCGIEKILFQSEGLRVCSECGEAERIIIESEIPSHNDTIVEKTHYPYKRINHLCEWLNQFQAKESTEIPDYIFIAIRLELKKMKISKIKKVTIQRVRGILRKLKYSEYYEHTVYIVSRLTGRAPPSLSRETEEKIKFMFKQIQEPFMRHCPSTRINFLSYSYVLHKIFKILNLDEYVHYFELLKSREKMRIQECIWEKICFDLGWPFYSSMNL